jgi:hypothetical protein
MKVFIEKTISWGHPPTKRFFCFVGKSEKFAVQTSYLELSVCMRSQITWRASPSRKKYSGRYRKETIIWQFLGSGKCLTFSY